MNNRGVRILKRCATGLLLAAGLGGCAVYGPPYAGDYYDPYYGNGGNSYYGSPVAVNLGLGYYSNNRRGDYRRDDYRRDGRGHGRQDGDGRGRGRDRH